MRRKISVGDQIVIHTKPNFWSSGLINNCPFSLKYPFIGVVKQIERDDINIGDYGFSLEHIGPYDIINEIKNPNYEIY